MTVENDEQRATDAEQEPEVTLVLGTKVKFDDGSWKRPVLLKDKLLMVGITIHTSSKTTGWIRLENHELEGDPIFAQDMPRYCSAQAILRAAGIEYL